MISRAEFKALAAQGYNRIPLMRMLQADLDTPLSLYLKLANKPNSFLLESVVGGERFGRYSFIGLPAKTRIEARHREILDKQKKGVSKDSTRLKRLIKDKDRDIVRMRGELQI